MRISTCYERQERPCPRQRQSASVQELYGEKDAAEQEIEKEAAAVARALFVSVVSDVAQMLATPRCVAQPAPVLSVDNHRSSARHEGRPNVLSSPGGVRDSVPCCAGDLGLELGKTIKLEWHKAANTRLRCLRITSKEEKAVRKQLGVCTRTAKGLNCTSQFLRLTSPHSQPSCRLISVAIARLALSPLPCSSRPDHNALLA